MTRSQIRGWLAVVVVITTCRTGGAQNSATYQGAGPSLNFNTTFDGGATFAQRWTLFADGVGFEVFDIDRSAFPLRIRPGALSSSIVATSDGLGLGLNGNVGVGTTTPLSKFEVVSSSLADFVEFDPGLANTARISNASENTQLNIETRSSTKTAAFRLSTPDHKFTHTLLGGSGRYVFRDATNATNPLVVESGTGTNNAIVIHSNGRIGLGKLAPTRPLDMASGAFCSVGGVWTNASSRELKQEIQELDSEEALQTLSDLKPVTYAYKSEPTEQHVGFIAEDVPDLVATNGRKGLSAMDVVAVLTKVAQRDREIIEQQQAQLDRQNALIDEHKSLILELAAEVRSLRQAVGK